MSRKTCGGIIATLGFLIWALPAVAVETGPLGMHWWQQADITTARAVSGQLLAYDDSIYVVCGSGPGASDLATNEVYSIAGNFWTTLASAPAGRSHPYTGLIGDTIYVIGGMNGSFQTTTYRYNILADSWMSDGAALPGSLRAYDPAVVSGDTIYLLGGQNGTTFYGTFLAYNTVADTWFTLPDIGEARGHAVATVYQGKIYVFGGYGAPYPTYFSSVIRYDTETGIWDTMTAMPIAMVHPYGWLIGNKFYIAAGTLASGAISTTVYEYDFSDNSWRTLESGSDLLPVRDGGLASGTPVSGYRVFAISGSDSGSTRIPRVDEGIPGCFDLTGTDTVTDGSAAAFTAVARYDNGDTITLYNDTAVFTVTAGTVSPTVVSFSAGIWSDTLTLSGASGNVTLTVTAQGWTDSFPVYVNSDTTGPNEWYVAVTGDTSNDGLTSGTAKRYLGNLLNGSANVLGYSLLTAGDTVNVAAGTYSETVSIDTDYVAIIGADSTTTIIDPGDSATASVKGISGTNRIGLLVQTLQILNAYLGIDFSNVDNSTIDNVTVQYAGFRSIYLENGSDTNTVEGTLLQYGNNIGIQLDVSAYNVINNCVIRYNPNNNGIGLVNAHWNQITNNVIDGNQWGLENPAGFPSDYNTISGNVFTNQSSWAGLNSSGGTGNLVCNNTFSQNAEGIRFNASSGNVFTQNTFDSNTTDLNIQAIGTETIQKNLFLSTTTTVTNGAAAFGLSRNWWGSTDTSSIQSYFTGTGFYYSPFRLGTVDTAAGADTMAPAAPDTVAANAVDSGTIALTWGAAYSNEEIGGALSDLAGYRVYRSLTADTSWWYRVADVGLATGYTDSGLTTDTTYCYRVTAYDNHLPWENESWYSDSIPSVSLTDFPSFVMTKSCTTSLGAADYVPAPGATLWFTIGYVNDGTAAGDSWVIIDTFDTAVVTFADTIAADDSPASGWGMQYGDAAGDLYDPGSIAAANVKYVRWWKQTLAVGETARMRYRVTVK